MNQGDRNLYQQFHSFIRQKQLLEQVDYIILGVSGGVDSMVLLHLFLQYRQQHKIDILAAHLNHSLRGQKADKDESLVKAYCQSINCAYTSRKVNVRAYAKKNNLSLEMAGRELRYNFFEEFARENPRSLIATAHTKDDQVETILYRIIRGAGVKGLAGIQLKRGNIIRPLLFASKEQLYEYAAQHQIPFSEDHTNRDEKIQRNFIRQSLIPSIKANLNPSFDTAVLRLSTISEDVTKFIHNAGTEALDDCFVYSNSIEIALDISRLKKYFTTVKIEVVRECFNRLNYPYPAVDYNMLTRIVQIAEEGTTGKRLRIAANLQAYVDRGNLIFEYDKNPHWQALQIVPGMEYKTDYFRFASEIVKDRDYSEGIEQRTIEYLDLDKLGENLVLRPWEKSDRIKPLNAPYTKKVSDIFIDQKIPLNKKKRIPILESDGKIVWVCGLKLSDEFKLKPMTRRTLKVYYEELL